MTGVQTCALPISNMGVVGRYILSSRIFNHIRTIKPGAGGELQLTDAIQSFLGQEQVLAYEYEGVRYDCGSKLGYVKANLAYAMSHPETGASFRRYVASGAWKKGL